MKKYLLSSFVVITFIGYAIYQRFNPQLATPTLISTDPLSTPTPRQLSSFGPPFPRSQTQTQGQGMMQGGGMHQGQYQNGTYTGPVVDAFYGYVQVQAVVTGGRLTDVKFLQYPNDRRTSQQINAQAMPYLKQEALVAQSANVDGVSGATQTSRAFIQSLQGALSRAQS